MAAVASAAGVVDDEPTSKDHDRIDLTYDVHMYLKGKNVLLEILEARGFDVSPVTSESPEELKNMEEDLLKHYLTVYEEGDVERTGRKCRIFFSKTIHKGATEASKHIGDQHPDPLNPDVDEILFIVFGTLSPSAIKMSIMWSREYKIQADAIQIQNLMVNPFKHELVPEYEPVMIGSEEETKIIESVLIKKKRQLPIIQKSDIIARFLGLRKEQLVIVRNKGPSGINTYVRVCLES
jgi:DNA-directed RNA polymerase subunit H (RpoH/RPB5)